MPDPAQARNRTGGAWRHAPWTPGTLGLNDSAAEALDFKGPLVADAGITRVDHRARKKKRRPKKSKTINIATIFPNPWKGKIADEIAAIDGNRWAPSSDDFEALMTRPYRVNSFNQFLGVLLMQGKGSIERVNIFTHSNADLIAFSGDIYPRTTFAEVKLNVTGALALQLLESLDARSYFDVTFGKGKKQKTKRYFIKDVRKRFKKGAVVVFYSCKTAMDARLLQEFADTFGVTAAGFRNKVCYCPKTYGRTRIDRRYVGLGSNCGGKSGNFTAIDRQWTERKPSP